MMNFSAFCVGLLTCGHVIGLDPISVEQGEISSTSDEDGGNKMLQPRTDKTTITSSIGPKIMKTLEPLVEEYNDAVHNLEAAIDDLKRTIDNMAASRELISQLERSTNTNTEKAVMFEHYSLKRKKKYDVLVNLVKANWYNAGKYCKLKGMELATIEDNEQQRELELLIESIGFTIESEEKFYWRSLGNPMTYTRWSRGEPNGGTKENCLVVWQSRRGFFWNNVDCTKEYYFVCQYLEASIGHKRDVEVISQEIGR